MSLIFERNTIFAFLCQWGLENADYPIQRGKKPPPCLQKKEVAWYEFGIPLHCH